MKRWWLLVVVASIIAFAVSLPVQLLFSDRISLFAAAAVSAISAAVVLALGVLLHRAHPPHARTAAAQHIGDALLNHDRLGLLSTDIDGVIETWNRGAQRMFGYGVGQALGQPLANFFSSESIDDIATLLRNSKLGSPTARELRALRPNGDTFYLHLAAFAPETPARRLIWYGVDISSRKRLERIVREVLDAGYGRDASEFLNFLTRQLAQTLNVGFAFIAERNPDQQSARMLSMWDGQQFYSPFDYALANTPCAELLGRDSVCFAERVAERFSHDDFLREHHIQSYLAVALFDSRGKALGHMGVMDTVAIPEPDHSATILRLFSARAAAGLERLHMDHAVQHRAAMEALLSEVSSGFVGVQSGSFDQKVNAALQRLGKFANVERVHLYRLTPDRDHATLAYLWSAPGTDTVPESYRSFDLDTFPWHWQQLKERGFVLVPEVSDLPEQAAAERTALQGGGVRSMLNVGMYESGRLTGFLGFESLHQVSLWPAEDLRLLRTVSEVLANAFERRKTEQTLRKLSSALNQAADAVMITDRRGVIEYVNPAFAQITGYTAEESIGHKPSLLRSGEHDDKYYKDLWDRVLRGEVYRGTVVNRRKDGSLYHEQKTITPLKDQRGNISHFISTGRDISESVRTQERLMYLAHHDALTDLPNRSLFMDRVQHAIARARRSGNQVALLFLDLDGFKEINDSLGHDAGDQLLCMVADRLRAAMRQGDTVSRLGGDEFTILIEGVDQWQDAGAVAQKVIDSLGQPYSIAQSVRRVSASVGISIYPRHGDRPDILLGKADKAMFEAKRESAGTYRFAD